MSTLPGKPIKSNIAVLIVITIISGVAYLNSLGNGFHFDDSHHIVNNIYIRSLKNIPLFFVDIRTFSFYEAEHYRPLILVSHAINYYFGRLNPAGYHIVNLGFHVGTAYLVFLVGQAILGVQNQETLHSKQAAYPPKGGYAACFAAVAAGLFFAVHPFNSEAVNYISARSTVMSAFFYLLAFYCWVKFRSQKPEARSQNTSYFLPLTSYFYIASILAFLLGMLTKEAVITLPVVLWLYDLYFVHRTSDKWKVKGLLVYIPYIVFVAIPYILLRTYLASSIHPSTGPSRGYYLNLLMQTKVLVTYLYLLFFPVNLSIEHAIVDVTSLWDWKVIGSIIILLSVIGLTILLYRSKESDLRVVSFFIIWFFITMLPTTLIPLNAPLQENRGYLAGAGFAIFLGFAVNRFAMRNQYRIPPKAFILVLILFLYSLSTINRNTFWKDDITLWLDAVEKSPMAWRAHHNLGYTYQKFKFDDLAISEYKKAIEIKRDYYQAMNKIGLIFLERGNLDLSLTEFKKAASVKPTDAESHMNLARVYLKLGQVDDARKESEIVVKLGEVFTVREEIVEEAQSYLRWINRKESPVQ